MRALLWTTMIAITGRAPAIVHAQPEAQRETSRGPQAVTAPRSDRALAFGLTTGQAFDAYTAVVRH